MIDDPSTTSPSLKMRFQMHPSWYVEFRMAKSPRRIIWSTWCFVLGSVFLVDGSNDAISGSIKFRMAAGRNLRKSQRHCAVSLRQHGVLVSEAGEVVAVRSVDVHVTDIRTTDTLYTGVKDGQTRAAIIKLAWCARRFEANCQDGLALLLCGWAVRFSYTRNDYLPTRHRIINCSPESTPHCSGMNVDIQRRKNQ